MNRTDPGGSRGLDDYFTRDMTRDIGAEIMGRNKFGPERGPWEDHEWKGWWGETPPFHTPVFVLTQSAASQRDHGAALITSHARRPGSLALSRIPGFRSCGSARRPAWSAN